MAIDIFPVPAAASGASDTSFAATIPTVQTTYEHDNEFTAGIYDIAIVPTTTNAQLIFLDDSSMLLTTNTVTGVVTIQLNSTATKVFITTLAGGNDNAIVKITKSSGLLFPENISSGTLDTITTTGTYNQTGKLAVLAFGGGGAGDKGNIDSVIGAYGGYAGGVAYGVVYTNTPTTVTIGAGGIAANSNNVNASAPGDSSFGNLLTSSTNSFFWVGGQGAGSINLQSNATAGSASRIFPSFNGNLTTGGGGGGNAATQNGNMSNASTVGGGSGIGTGGTSAPGNFAGGGSAAHVHNPTTRGTAGTGRASGGGAGIQVGGSYPNAAGRFGGDGTAGVVYVLRGF